MRSARNLQALKGQRVGERANCSSHTPHPTTCKHKERKTKQNKYGELTAVIVGEKLSAHVP